MPLKGSCKLTHTHAIGNVTEVTMTLGFKPAARLGWASAPLALVAAIGVFVAATIWDRGDRSECEALIDDIAEIHQVYSRAHRHVLKVPADQVQELMAWLGNHVRRNVEAPNLAAAGLRFAGGRMLVINGGQVAELYYARDDGLPIALCIAPMPGRNAPLNVEQRGEQRAAYWVKGGFAFIVVGEIDRRTAETLAALVGAQIDS
jgi:anti-sigma factor RsiW